MRPTARPLALTLLAALVLGTAGCGAAADKVAEKVTEEATERAIESQGGEGANVDIGSDGSVEIETEDGSYSAGAGEVPKGWPEDIPLPDDLEVVTGTDMGSATESLSSVIGTTGQSPDEIEAFFEDALGSWDEANRFTSNSDGSSLTSLSYVSGDRTLGLTISQDADGTTTISLTHATQTPE